MSVNRRRGASADGGPRSTFALLFDRNFGPFFWGKTASSAGIWIQNIAAAVFIFELTGSATMVGLISVFQFLGPLTLALPSGALSDRFNRRNLIIVGRLCALAGSVLLVIYSVTGPFGPITNPALPVFGAAGLLGVGLGLSAPAQHALVPSLVSAQDLDQAVALTSATGNVARTTGPAVGALLLIIGGPTLAFLGAAVAHLTYILALLRIRSTASTGTIKRMSFNQLLGGITFIRREQPRLAMLLFGVAAIGIGIDPIVTLTPTIAASFGASEALVGIFASSFGIGAVLTVFLVRPARRMYGLRALSMCGFLVLAAGQLIVAFSQTPLTSIIGFAVTGSGFLLGSSGLTARIQHQIPDAVRGRIMALWSLAFLGARPLGAALNGYLADTRSVTVALMTGAAITIVSILFASVRVDVAREAEHDAADAEIVEMGGT